MTSTVVGAALIAAITVACEYLGHVDNEEEPSSKLVSVDFSGVALRIPRRLDLGSTSEFTTSSLEQKAGQTVSLCFCEGQDHVTNRRIRACQKCYHTTCERCGGNPQHYYGPYGEGYVTPRAQPQSFERMIKKALPMRIRLTHIDIEALATVQTVDDDEIWSSILFDLNDPGVEDLRFRSTVRNQKWTVSYSSSKYRMDLIFFGGKATWFLYALPEPSEPAKSPKRKTLMSPLARMEAQGDDPLSGSWQFRVPSTSTLKVKIIGLGKTVPAWEAKLGLPEAEWADMTVSEALSVTLAEPVPDSWFEKEISGKYELLDDCDTANHKLYKRLPVDEEAEPLFLFFDPHRYGDPDHDYFVFAREKCRLDYQEQRHILARLSEKWRPTELSDEAVDCFVDSRWIPIAADLEPFAGVGTPEYSVIRHAFNPNVAFGITRLNGNEEWDLCQAATLNILCSDITVNEEDFKEWEGTAWTTVQPPDHHVVLSELSFLINRINHLDGFSDLWRPLALPVLITRCSTCAPRAPDLKWQSKRQGKSAWRIVPYEDEDQANHFEEQMRHRPDTVVLQIYKDDNHVVHMRIGINVAALAHQALANLQGLHDSIDSTNEPCTAQWRLDKQYKHYRKVNLPLFTLQHNRSDCESQHIFHLKPDPDPDDPYTELDPQRQLRTEQKRSLEWMISQESPEAAPFLRQEVAEGMIPQVGFRAEVLAQQNDLSARGGVLADQVGYGKTVTALGLIDSQMGAAMEHIEQEPCVGRIPTKATLVIVPATLVNQWKGQAEKFLGFRYKVLTLMTVAHLNKYSVREIQEAGIIIASWSLFASDTYTERVAYLAALPPGPPAKTGGRPFEAWLKRASTEIPETLEQMRDAESRNELESYVTILNRRVEDNQDDPKLIRRLPTRRTKGEKFNQEHKRWQQKRATRTAEIVDHTKPDAGGVKARVRTSENIFNLAKCEGKLENLKGLPFHIYRWDRIVLDEYTYVGPRLYQSIVTIPSRYRWVLSGTPRINNFGEVKELAGLIGLDLGIDDDTSASMSAALIRRFRAERTSAETFRAFNETHSPDWYEQRHAHAQYFLDFFVRQNRAEIEDIKSVIKIIAVDQTPIERAMYLELEQQLRGHDMKMVKTGKSKMQNAQVSRLKKLYNNSATAEEALLKAAAFSDFGTRTARTPDEACRHVLYQRFSHLAKCKNEMARQFEKAIWLLNECDNNFPDVHFEKFRVSVENGAYVGDEDVTQIMLDALKEAEDAYHPDNGYRFFLREDIYEVYSNQESEKLKARREAAKKAAKAERKAQKAKRVKAERKRKELHPDIGDEYEAVVEEEEEEEEESDKEAEEEDQAEERAIEDSYAEIDFEIWPDTAEHAKLSLRTLTARLRSNVREMVELLRGIRYLLAVRYLQKAQVQGSNLACKCISCGEIIADLQEAAVLGKCGHITCTDCLNQRGRELNCVEKDCQAPALSHHIHHAPTLGVDNSAKIEFGAKTDAIIALIKRIPKQEQVLVFVQWTDIGHMLEEAFDKKDIAYYTLLHSQEKDRAAAMNDFQNHPILPSEPAPDGMKHKYRQVLILNSSDESAAGA